MEVNRLHTNFDWDSLYGDPWDLANANIDISMRCYPTRHLQIPLQYVQTNAHNSGYSIGVEYQYQLFNRLKDRQSRGGNVGEADGESYEAEGYANRMFYDFFYDDDDFEEMQQEQEDDFQYEWDSFHDSFYRQQPPQNDDTSWGQSQSAEDLLKRQRQEFVARRSHRNANQHDRQLREDQFREVLRDSEEKRGQFLALPDSTSCTRGTTAAVQRPQRIRQFDTGGAEVTIEDYAAPVQESGSGIIDSFRLIERSLPCSGIAEIGLNELRRSRTTRMAFSESPHKLLPSLLLGGHTHLWKTLVELIDLKFVQGVFKLHIQRPLEEHRVLRHMFRDEESNKLYSHLCATSPTFLLESSDTNEIAPHTFDKAPPSRALLRFFRNLPHVVVMNYLSALFGRNKLSASVGLNTKLRTWTSKLIARRKFYFLKSLANIGRPLYLAASVVNPFHPERNRIVGLSASIRGFTLQAKRLGRRNAIVFSKRGYWTPFPITTRQSLLRTWRKEYEPEELMVLPPPPQFDSASNVLPYQGSVHERLVGRAKNVVHQLSKVFRYFVDLQLATLRHTWKNFYPVRWKRYRSFALSRIYEQLYLLSLGCRSRVAVEYSWRRDKSLQLLQGFRVPLEFNWGCDVFRIWAFLDLVSEHSSRTGKWSNRHSATITATLFDVYTLFSFTLSLHPLYRKLKVWWCWVSNAIRGLQEPKSTVGAKNPGARMDP